MNDRANRWVARAMIGLASLLGGASLLAFAVFLFRGAFPLVNLGFREPGVLALDALLSVAFFVQHSVMVRKPFRMRLARRIPGHYLDAVYAIASGVALLTLVALWQPSAHTLATADGPLRWVLRGVFVLAAAGAVWSLRALGSLDTFGVDAIRNRLRGTRPRPGALMIRGPYRWVRHPLYLVSLLMIWSGPDLSRDRLLFNVLWTIWIVVGTVLEERDLVAGFGESYRRYQRAVPMLIPWRVQPCPATVRPGTREE